MALISQEVFRGQKMLVNRVYHDPCESHSDPEVEYSDWHSVHFVERGSFSFRSRAGSGELTQDHALVCQPGMEYTCRHPTTLPNDEFFGVAFLPELVEDPSIFAVPHAKPDYRKLYLKRRIEQAALSRDELALQWWAHQLLETLGANGTDTQLRYDPSIGRRHLDGVVWIIDKMRRDPALDYSLADLASLVNLSVFHFCKVFRGFAGETAHQTLIKSRLRRAAEMLLEKSTVTDACFAVGFNNLSHFVRSFTTSFGVTPSMFRQTYRWRNRK